MERGASPGTMHNLMAGTAAIIVVACASAPAPRAPALAAVDDAAITVQVKAAIVDRDAGKAHEINVGTADGIVQLNGFVDDENEKHMIETVVRGVAGVRDVTNDLEPRSTALKGSERP